MDIREEFLSYFKSKTHKAYESMPLVPDDASLLFTNSGMVQFKDVFTAKIPIPQNPTATSCQLCLRAGGKHNDLENVGYTSRHHTLFEMLGNFSFGDYFKAEAIDFAWEFVTERLELPKEKLWVTIHESDDEAFNLWQKHISPDKIKKFGDKDNFWQMGDTGACGPCSEIFYDQGEVHFNSSEDYLGGDGDRFLEIWNLVFMQYERDSNGVLHPLPKPSIDTGMGLERITAIKEGVLSNFDSSLFMPIIREVEELVKKEYSYKSGASFRVIADHIRAVSFLLAQGVNFDREGRGYVLRRILRRAVRHGYLLGLKEPFLYKLVDRLADIMRHYSYLEEKKEVIKSQIQMEEERFFATIESGMELFSAELTNTKEIFSGEIAFKLYDTYGFPLDLTEDMLRDKNLKVDNAKFTELMAKQKARAKANWKGSGSEAKEGDFKTLIDKFGINEFIGYANTSSNSKILALLDSDLNEVSELKANESGWVMFDKTPFYAESGGQAGDIGNINQKAKVIDTKKFFGLNLSQIETIENLKVNENADLIVDNSRFEIAKHHSATHILHSGLRKILGEHISQAGSLVEANRLRFDFSHPKSLANEEIEQIEKFVNDVVSRNILSEIKEMAIEEAKQKGAMALFSEKYGDIVRVVSFGDVSCELCGGTHLNSTSEIGSFFIIKESGVSAGVRRIEAICGASAYKYAKESLNLITKAQSELKNRDILLGINRLKESVKSLKDELNKATSGKKQDLNQTMINGVKVVVDVIEAGEIKNIIDELKNQNESIAIMLFQASGEKVLIASGVKNANIKAGEWVKNIAPILGGGGGGRDDFAQAGGKDSSKINEALSKALEFVKTKI